MPEHRDTAESIHLPTDDALGLAELLTFLSDWFKDPDAGLLAASLRRFVGTTGYELTDLQTDLDRFATQLGAERSP